MPTTTSHTFLPKRGNYRGLIAYQKAECIYDITFYFAHTYFEKSDRTIDQMVQAARSGKQNIAEGSAALPPPPKQNSNSSTWHVPVCKSCWSIIPITCEYTAWSNGLWIPRKPDRHVKCAVSTMIRRITAQPLPNGVQKP